MSRSFVTSARLVVIEQHPIVGWALARAADGQPDLVSAGTVETVDDALTLIPAAGADVVTLGIETHEFAADLEHIARLHRRFPLLPIVVLTSEPVGQDMFAALDAGASRVLTKRAPIVDLLSVIRDAAFTRSALDGRGRLPA